GVSMCDASGSGTSASRRAESGPLRSTIWIAFIGSWLRALAVAGEGDHLLDPARAVRVPHRLQRQRPEVDLLGRRVRVPLGRIAGTLLGRDLVARLVDRLPDVALALLELALAAVGEVERARHMPAEERIDVAVEVLVPARVLASRRLIEAREQAVELVELRADPRLHERVCDVRPR